MFHCGKSHKRNETIISDHEISLQKNTRFSREEIKSIRNRFYRISNAKNKISKSQFRENMGLLGLETVFFISDRIFEMLDTDKDEEEFINYMDILVNGNQEEKYRLSFRLFDRENRNYFTIEDFSYMISSMVSIWCVLTGAQFTIDINRKIDFYIKHIFNEMDYDHKKEISFEKYVKALEKDPNLLEIYDFMNNSFNNNILGQSLNNSTTELKEFMIDIKNLEYNLEKLNKYLNKNHHLNDKNLSIFSENSPLNKKHHDYSININPKKSLLIDLNQNKISSEFEAKQFFSAKLDNKEPNQIHFSFSNMNSPNSNTKIRTFQKIDENVKKLLLKANLEKSPGLNSQENKNENLLINEITERHVAQPVRNFSEMTKFFQEKHKAIFHKIEEKLSEESDIFGESEFSEENKSKKDVFQSCLSIDSPKVNSPIMKKEESKELFPYFIEELHMQAKNLREQIEKKLKRNKNDNNNNSFTVLNVHKPLKIKHSGLLKGNKDNLVFLGHENWNFVLNMMLGIQTSVKSLDRSKDYILSSKDFKLKFSFELIPRRIKNSMDTTKICNFFDYAPYVFQELRNLFGIRTEDYLKSIGPENMLSNLLKGNLNTLTELVSCGKSGSFFYYSVDGRFTLKTIHRHEFHFLMKILKSYYEHISQNPKTHIIKFFGLHKMRFKLSNSIRPKKLYIIIMSNVFHTSKEIHERYDLKGSTYKRKTKEKEEVVKKDLDAIEKNLKIKITPEKADCFLEQLKKDCVFFEKNNIIDYSLLVGIHYKGIHFDMKDQHKTLSLDDSFQSNNNNIILDLELNQNKFEENRMISSDNSCIYFIGIIDILTCFNAKKKLEYIIKRVSVGKEISAIPPMAYSQRFQQFIKLITEISFGI